MPTMILRVDLKKGVSPEEYEPLDPRALRPGGEDPPSVEDWRDSRVGGPLASVAHPPYQYMLTLEIKDPKQLRQNIASEEMQRHFYQLYQLTEITQFISDRFA